VTGQVTENKFGPLDFEQLDKCPWCASSNRRQWGEGVGLFNTVECATCGLVYVNRRLNSKARSKYYESYFSEEHQAVPEAEVRDKMYQLEFDFIYRYVKRGKVRLMGFVGYRLEKTATLFQRPAANPSRIFPNSPSLIFPYLMWSCISRSQR